MYKRQGLKDGLPIALGYLSVSFTFGMMAVEGGLPVFTAVSYTHLDVYKRQANECAIKLARKYSFDRYGESRNTIISLVNSFHGRTMATLTATGQEMCIRDRIIAPWREWDIKSRDEEIDYAEAHQIPRKINRETNYSKDKNVLHLAHEGLDLENPANEPQYNNCLLYTSRCV